MSLRLSAALGTSPDFWRDDNDKMIDECLAALQKPKRRG
jgi:hypothetical protein